MKRKVILIDSRLRKVLMERYGFSHATIKRALEYRTDTSTAKMIQEYALEHGGEVWVPLKEVAATAEGSPTDQGEAVEPTNEA